MWNVQPKLPFMCSSLSAGLASAAALLYNSTGTLDCFDFLAGVNNASSIVDRLWNWQYCTEMFQPFGMDGGEFCEGILQIQFIQLLGHEMWSVLWTEMWTVV